MFVIKSRLIGTLRAVRSVITLFAFFCLTAALMFTGCQMEEDEDPSIIGEWKLVYTNGEEVYRITSARFEYDPGNDGGYKGDIKEIKYFTKTSGVIIVEYDQDAKPKYYEYEWEEPYGIISGPEGPLGDFQGIFFRDLTSSKVKLANASDTSGTDQYSRAEADTLQTAKTKFTSDNVDSFVWDWAYVSTQTRQ